MTRQQLKSILSTFNGNYRSISSSITKNHKHWIIIQELNTHTSFYDVNNISVIDQIYIIMNDIVETKLCECGCGGNIKPKLSFLPKHHLKTKSNKYKIRQTCMDRYGVDNVSKLDTIKDKKKQTSIVNWGDTSYMKTTDGKTHHNQCVFDIHGVNNVFQLPDVKQKINDNWIINKSDIIKKRVEHGKINFINTLKQKLKSVNISINFDINEYIGVSNSKKYEFTCNKCNSVFFDDIDNGSIPRCVICDPPINMIGSSNIETELQYYIGSTMGLDIQTNTRIVISPLELDIFIPSKNIAIEFNGNYWHSELNGKTRNYHLNKTNMCQENGIRLIHIFEDEWKFKQTIVKNRLRHILGKTKYRIQARKCEIREISPKLSNEFLNKYHIQGSDRSSIRLGLFYKNRMISVMTFSKRRFDKKYGFELVRYCTIGHFTIIGGAGKLLKYFERNWKPESIISYADKRWSNGGLYESLGFIHSHDSTPNYFYMSDYMLRQTRHKFQKHKLSNVLSKFDPKLSEWDNMKNNGFDRIWDCGNMVFTK